MALAPGSRLWALYARPRRNWSGPSTWRIRDSTRSEITARHHHARVHRMGRLQGPVHAEDADIEDYQGTATTAATATEFKATCSHRYQRSVAQDSSAYTREFHCFISHRCCNKNEHVANREIFQRFSLFLLTLEPEAIATAARYVHVRGLPRDEGQRTSVHSSAELEYHGRCATCQWLA